MLTAEPGTRDLVVGLGNPLMGDDGTGIAALERLRDAYDVPDEVELADGGTWGMNLLPMIEDARRVLFLDAIRAGKAPGESAILRDDEIPRALTVKLSPHQVDLRDVLAAAQLCGAVPATMVAIGLEPGEVEMGVGLTPAVADRLDQLVIMAVQQLRAWGHECRAREPGGSASGA